MCYVVGLFLSNPNFLKFPIFPNFPNLFKLHRPIHTHCSRKISPQNLAVRLKKYTFVLEKWCFAAASRACERRACRTTEA